MNKLLQVSLLFLLIVSTSTVTVGQTIKAGVLVVGANSYGFSAAIQSAHSGVKTIMVDEGSISEVNIDAQEMTGGSGIIKTLIERIEKVQRFPVKKDQPIAPSFAATIFNAWADTVKNLTVLKSKKITRIERDGKYWKTTLSDNSLIRTEAVVDASKDYKTLMTANGKYYPDSNRLSDTAYKDKRFRTGVAIINKSSVKPSTYPLKALTSSKDNFFVCGNRQLGFNMTQAQAAGAAAAFCSFFKTDQRKLNVRTIQNELTNYGARLLSFDDIGSTDAHFIAIQSMGLTGLLKGASGASEFLYMPDSTVSTTEIRDTMKEYFSRSQIWFLDKSSSRMTVKDLLSLIKFVAYRGKELDSEVAKAWNSTLKLSGVFSQDLVLTRRQFAVLLNTYIQPFKVSVDLDGKLKR